MKIVIGTALGLSLLAAGISPALAASTATMPPKLPSLREQDAIRQEWLSCVSTGSFRPSCGATGCRCGS